jgi:ribosomal protein S12 methylthiotransferase accessory factor YcaO
MPLTEPDKSEWLVRRIQELSNQVGTLERDSKRDADKRTIQLEQLDADLTSAKLEFSENISKLTSDGFGLEVLAVSLLFIGAVFGLLSFL